MRALQAASAAAAAAAMPLRVLRPAAVARRWRDPRLYSDPLWLTGLLHRQQSTQPPRENAESWMAALLATLGTTRGSVAAAAVQSRVDALPDDRARARFLCRLLAHREVHETKPYLYLDGLERLLALDARTCGSSAARRAVQARLWSFLLYQANHGHVRPLWRFFHGQKPDAALLFGPEFHVAAAAQSVRRVLVGLSRAFPRPDALSASAAPALEAMYCETLDGLWACVVGGPVAQNATVRAAAAAAYAAAGGLGAATRIAQSALDDGGDGAARVVTALLGALRTLDGGTLRDWYDRLVARGVTPGPQTLSVLYARLLEACGKDDVAADAAGRFIAGEMRRWGYPPNVFVLNTDLQRLIRRGRHDRAWSLISSEMPAADVAPNHVTVTLAVQIALPEAQEWVAEQLQRPTLDFDQQLLHALLRSTGSSPRRARAILALFLERQTGSGRLLDPLVETAAPELATAGLALGIRNCNAVLDLAVASRDLWLAVRVLEMAGAARLAPTRTTWTLLLAATELAPAGAAVRSEAAAFGLSPGGGLQRFVPADFHRLRQQFVSECAEGGGLGERESVAAATRA